MEHDFIFANEKIVEIICDLPNAVLKKRGNEQISFFLVSLLEHESNFGVF